MMYVRSVSLFLASNGLESKSDATGKLCLICGAALPTRPLLHTERYQTFLEVEFRAAVR